MNKLLILSLLALGYQSASAQLVTESFGSGDNAFTMDFVTIGNPNNMAMVHNTGRFAGHSVGAVSYTYNLGKYEVSRGQIDKANAAGSLGITLWDMTSYGGNGVNKPATGISWNAGARIVNWLNISKGFQPAYKFTTSGVNDNLSLWSVSDSAQNGKNRFRHKDSIFFLPNMDEWYKAAYGSNEGSWYNFPTGSNSTPTPVTGGTLGGTAVYASPNEAPADINNAGGLSAFGTMAQGGNVWEWIEASTILIQGRYSSNDPMVYFGGSAIDMFGFGSDPLSASGESFEGNYPEQHGSFDVGFRVAMLPEPSSLSLLALGGVVVALRRRR